MLDSKKIIKVVFTGGGTGGHVYPGIAIADELSALSREKGFDVEIYWIGNNKGMDCNIVQKSLVENGGSINAFYGISSGKLRRYFSFQNFIDVFKIIRGFFQALSILRKIKPDCLFSKGGFVSVPPCFAAKILKIPYYTHECDFSLGLANRLNAGSAKNILVSYQETASSLGKEQAAKCIVTGNPIRSVFYEDTKASGFEFLGIPQNHEKPVLLVLGGSLGAKQINDLILQNIDWIKEKYTVVHQTGIAFASENPDLIAKKDSEWKIYPFIYKEMPSVIQAADVILSRSGANSIWECAACRKTMILIPLCGKGTRGDQVDNARFFEKNNAAHVLAGTDANSQNLRKSLEYFYDKTNRDLFAEACGSLCKEHPANVIANIILSGIDNDSANN